MQSLCENHILAITDLDSLRADYPILDVFTIREVITLLLHLRFLLNRGNQGSKGLPDIIRYLALMNNSLKLAVFLAPLGHTF